MAKTDTPPPKSRTAQFEYQNDEATAYEAWIYEIEYDIRDDDNMENSYFVVVHNGDVVLKTMLVDSLT